MWPWGHLAFGYFLYSGYTRLSSVREFDGYTVLLIVFGTQFPDIVDKPLAWTFHVLPSGRSLAHSVFAAVFVSTLIAMYCRKRGRSDLGIAFAVGYFSHLVGDGLRALLSGEYAYLSYLGWPILPPPPFEDEGGFLTQLQSIEFTPAFILQFVVFGAILYVVWIEDGAPGRKEIRRFLENLPIIHK
jgi:hypothetical protein